MSSLIAVERGQMQSADIVQVLRECVDDLKLTRCHRADLGREQRPESPVAQSDAVTELWPQTLPLRDTD